MYIQRCIDFFFAISNGTCVYNVMNRKAFDDEFKKFVNVLHLNDTDAYSTVCVFFYFVNKNKKSKIWFCFF